MFTKDYFLKRLQAGEDMGDIGDAIAEAMNEAQAEYDAEEKAKAAALAKARQEQKAREEAVAARKRAIAAQICELIGEYGTIECPQCAEMFKVSEEDVDALIDGMSNIFGLVELLGSGLGTISNPVDNTPKTVVGKVRSDDEIIEDFLKGFIR